MTKSGIQPTADSDNQTHVLRTCVIDLQQKTKPGGSNASISCPRVVQSCLVMVMATPGRAKAVLHYQLTCTHLPPLLCDALLRVAVHPLDSILCPLPELFQQFYPARIVPGDRPGDACSATQALLVPAFSIDGTAAGHHRWNEPIQPTD